MHPKDVMIYSDMDGTLLSSWKRGPIISDENRKAIEEWIEEGGLFSIATGRNRKNGPTYFENHHLVLPMVLVNGALIYDQHKNLVIRKQLISLSFVDEALHYFKNNRKVALVISDLDEVYHVKHPLIQDSDLPELDFQTTVITIDQVKNLEILKVTFVTNPEDREYIEEDIKKMKTYHEISISPSSKRFIEIVAYGINKAEAIIYVKHLYQLDNRKLICIGDYHNDTEMLDIADLAAVPKNGLASLKTEGRLVTSDHDEDAIADLISKIKAMQ